MVQKHQNAMQLEAAAGNQKQQPEKEMQGVKYKYQKSFLLPQDGDQSGNWHFMRFDEKLIQRDCEMDPTDNTEDILVTASSY